MHMVTFTINNIPPMSAFILYIKYIITISPIPEMRLRVNYLTSIFQRLQMSWNLCSHWCLGMDYKSGGLCDQPYSFRVTSLVHNMVQIQSHNSDDELNIYIYVITIWPGQRFCRILRSKILWVLVRVLVEKHRLHWLGVLLMRCTHRWSSMRRAPWAMPCRAPQRPRSTLAK